MSAVESSPCKNSWALEVSERRSGSTTSVEKEAKVCDSRSLDKTGLQKITGFELIVEK